MKHNTGCIIGGILNHRHNGYGFKITFNTPTLAQQYKDMFYGIIKNDNITIETQKGYHDRKED